ncbi:XRE family transcriptional regulator [Taibaiella chishuiensis]|uniref:Helix-turn-helix protein n=1 Tax=Taibaiella chishuiensis TaxID=1434707 RepID=A0A2P8D7L3_9BACT|nr:helix-turn-helix domain-containing protein [Taibaiella chishuiensis]PSK93225.1 helix-turn-helix protein [Taibaiella chishuiensis]
MAGTKIFFHTNIRFLRERKRFSQDDLSQLIDISRIKLQALESGRTKNPSAADLVKFSEQFRISIDALLKINLPVLGELKIRELEAGNDVYMTGGKLRVLAITVDKSNKENLEYIPLKAKAGYARSYNDPQYLAGLPRFSLPNLPKGTFRMFPTTGDSMLPFPEGCDIIGHYLEDWKNIKARTPCIVVLNGMQDIVFKLVTLGTDRNILLESLNPGYQPYTVAAADVLELWQFHSYHTRVVPEPQADLQHIAGSIKTILTEIQALKSAKR